MKPHIFDQYDGLGSSPDFGCIINRGEHPQQISTMGYLGGWIGTLKPGDSVKLSPKYGRSLITIKGECEIDLRRDNS